MAELTVGARTAPTAGGPSLPASENGRTPAVDHRPRSGGPRGRGTLGKTPTVRRPRRPRDRGRVVGLHPTRRTHHRRRPPGGQRSSTRARGGDRVRPSDRRRRPRPGRDDHHRGVEQRPESFRRDGPSATAATLRQAKASGEHGEDQRAGAEPGRRGADASRGTPVPVAATPTPADPEAGRGDGSRRRAPPQVRAPASTRRPPGEAARDVAPTPTPDDRPTPDRGSPHRRQTSHAQTGPGSPRPVRRRAAGDDVDRTGPALRTREPDHRRRDPEPPTTSSARPARIRRRPALSTARAPRADAPTAAGTSRIGAARPRPRPRIERELPAAIGSPDVPDWGRLRRCEDPR